MANCCYPDEYGKIFSAREAEKDRKRYLAEGLRGSQAAMADLITAQGIEGASVLEVGGGVGALHVDLLIRGAGSAVNVELTDVWSPAATALLEATRMQDRVERHSGDFVDKHADLPPADVVLLHRVVCCYPHWTAMLDAGASKATRVIGMTFPRDTVGARLVTRTGNALLRWRHRSFQVFIHPVDAMLGRLSSSGFEMVAERSGPIWRTVVFART
ncbi:MAG: methyltransferase [Acidimicrobiia bacterium]|nr:methyltransferase [Acidimicrobiia bacterium]